MKKRGFTLIELMVAMGLFATVLTFIVSLFLQSVRAERVVAKRAAAIDNVSLAVEQMAREIRTGSNFPSVPANGEQKSNTLSFTNYKGEKVIYRLMGDVIEKRTNDGADFLPLSSQNVKIKRLDFWMMDKSSDGLKRFTPRITIIVQAEGPFESPFNLQTSVGGRLLYFTP